MSVTKSQQLISDTQLLEGIQKYLPTGSFTLLSKPETAAEVMKVLQVRVDKAQAVIKAKAAYHGAVLASDQEDAESGVFVADVRTIILTMYSNSPEVLVGFGLAPRKVPAPMTVAEKLIAVEKRSATRAARHTMGRVQKAAIKGSLTGTIQVPVEGGEPTVVSAPPSPATPATPAVTNGASAPRS